ncbi:hypothetical protein AVEN_163379-1 [Araneus ventricosus]|uniref:Uncharacterized protein n=1 Tax=Araneus ventricosus TaxID=182803 RepID=A0A4Y2Q3N9_ARAVE|nr:hypothetical protein AVEN_98350-1 [Araneus ventricosus]GBN56926.1 hypothetical protein AVEN_163379-1 [Araneus ventricosus]
MGERIENERIYHTLSGWKASVETREDACVVKMEDAVKTNNKEQRICLIENFTVAQISKHYLPYINVEVNRVQFERFPKFHKRLQLRR